jgi:hypothetical protein
LKKKLKKKIGERLKNDAPFQGKMAVRPLPSPHGSFVDSQMGCAKRVLFVPTKLVPIV